MDGYTAEVWDVNRTATIWHQKIALLFLIFLTGLPSQHVWGDPLSPASPESAGFSSDRLQRIGTFLGGLSNRGELSGSVALILRDGQEVYSKAFGWANIDDKKPMEIDSIVRIFSMTKPIACVAALILLEEGRLLLTDPVSHYVPGFGDAEVYVGVENQEIRTEPIERPISIQMLASHTSGMAYTPSSDDYPILSELFEQADIGDPGSRFNKWSTHWPSCL